MYEQTPSIESANDAKNLYYLGEKYNVAQATHLASICLLNMVGAAENLDVIHGVGVTFNDSSLISAVWLNLKEPICKWLKNFFIAPNEPLKNSYFEATTLALADLDAGLIEQTLKNLEKGPPIKPAIEDALGVIAMLITQAKCIFRAIEPQKTLDIDCKLVWRPPTSSIAKMQKLWSPFFNGIRTFFGEDSDRGEDEYSSQSFRGSVYSDSDSDTIAHNEAQGDTEIREIIKKYCHAELCLYSVSDLEKIYNFFEGRNRL